MSAFADRGCRLSVITDVELQRSRTEAVIDEVGPVGSGQIRLIVSTKAYRHGDVMNLIAGVLQAVGEASTIGKQSKSLHDDGDPRRLVRIRPHSDSPPGVSLPRPGRPGRCQVSETPVSDANINRAGESGPGRSPDPTPKRHLSGMPLGTSSSQTRPRRTPSSQEHASATLPVV